MKVYAPICVSDCRADCVRVDLRKKTDYFLHFVYQESSRMHRLVLKTSEICVNIYSNKKIGALSQSRTLCDIFLNF